MTTRLQQILTCKHRHISLQVKTGSHFLSVVAHYAHADILGAFGRHAVDAAYQIRVWLAP